MFSCNKIFMLFVLITLSKTKGDGHKILLSVYYESKCPDSKSFILNQLQPAVQLLQDHLKLRLVPFGKAKIDYNDPTNFVCQHGIYECLGNMIQDCVLNIMSDRTDVDKSQYVACEMISEESTKGNMKCVKNANVTPLSVAYCLKSGEGYTLQYKSEHLTKLIKPTFIPTITIDGVFNQQIHDNALIDLTETLCSILKETKVCAQYYNDRAMKELIYYNEYYP